MQRFKCTENIEIKDLFITFSPNCTISHNFTSTAGQIFAQLGYFPLYMFHKRFTKWCGPVQKCKIL